MMRSGFQLRWFAISAILVVSMARAGEGPMPVPNSSAQTKIVNSIREQYREEYAKRTADDQLKLARNFQQQASLAAEDPVRQYVLLREARELATNSGNLEAAFSIVDDTAKLFAVDAAELKTTVMSNAMDRALIPRLELMDHYLKACDQALGRGDVQFANQACVLAREIARATRNPAITGKVHEVELRVHDARRALTVVAEAANKLNRNPEDADAKLIVGRYVCFIQGRWDEGLPLLAGGSDKSLKELAEQDLQSPSDPKKMFDLARAWWDQPDSKAAPQAAARRRAAFWYQQALPDLKGEQKAQAEKRLAEVKGQ